MPGTYLGSASTSAPFVPLPGSAFDMSFTTNQYSVASLANLSITRAQTVPSYVDNTNGTVTSFAANTLRIAPGKGLLIEGPSTNLALHSGDLSNASWTTAISGAGAITVTGNAGVAPDGTSTAALVAINRSSSSADRAQISQTFTSTAAAYSGSFYVKANSNSDIGKSITVALFDGTTVTPATIILTGGWQRGLAANVTLASSAGAQVIVGYLTNDFAGLGAVSFQVWGGQVELNPGVSSYIPTTTAPVTRNGDAITATGIILSTYQSAGVTQYARLVGVESFTAGDRIGASFGSGETPAFKTTNTTINAYNGSVSATAATIGNGISFTTLGGVIASVSSYAPSSISNVANGGTDQSVALSMPAVTAVYIASDRGTGSFLNGYLARLAGWNSQLIQLFRVNTSATFTTTSVSIGGWNTNYLVPVNVPLSGTYVQYYHGAGETETAWTTEAVKFGVRESLLAQGHILSASAAADENWGNTAGINAYVAQYADAITRFTINKTVGFSESMGGLAGQLIIAGNLVPLHSWYGIYPVCNLANMYAGTFQTEINTAYNIPAGGTYAVQTAGHDPVLLPGSDFTIRMRFTSSSGDTTVNKAANAVQMQTLVAPTAAESVLLNTIGNHGDASNFIPYDVVNFFAR